jgi:hypothetical protein
VPAVREVTAAGPATDSGFDGRVTVSSTLLVPFDRKRRVDANVDRAFPVRRPRKHRAGEVGLLVVELAHERQSQVLFGQLYPVCSRDRELLGFPKEK